MVNLLDEPSRIDTIRRTVKRKRSLRRFYAKAYEKYAECLARCPDKGVALELGSGGGFAREILPQVVMSDIIRYPGMDLVFDATRFPFPDNSVRFVGIMNVFHHLPDVAAFLAELERCLVPGGRVWMLDQHPGWISTPILKYLHHESFRPQAETWHFDSEGPLSGANGALPWIVFQRERARFEKEFPKLELAAYSPHTPLSYWLSGGIKGRDLIPGFLAGLAAGVDSLLTRISAKRFGSFVDVELVKR